MLGYYVPEPDEAMLISGAKSDFDDAPFVVVVGHGKWVMPFFRKVRFLSMALHEATIREVCVTTQGIQLNVRAVIAHKVGMTWRRSSTPDSASSPSRRTR